MVFSMKYPLHQQLALAIEALVSRPPSATGQRLAPERILCENLGVSRVTVRRAVDDLVARGILVRRHGSGTYLRKIPSPPAVPGDLETVFDLHPEQVFAGKTFNATRLCLPVAGRSLRLLALVNTRSEFVGRVLEGMQRRAGEGGHHLEHVSVRAAGPSEETRLRERLDGERFDGYVIDSAFAGVFDRLFAESRPPVAYLGHGAFDPDYEPVIQPDQQHALQRALHKLHGVGYRRIGLVCCADAAQRIQQPQFYEQAMLALELEYRCVIQCPDRAGIREQVRTMLNRPSRPEAIYVGDDILLRRLVRPLEQEGCIPGKDIAVITLGSYGVPLPAGYDWSIMEFNPVQMGTMAMESLLREITRAGEPLCSIAHRAAWHAGRTHLVS